MKIASLVSLLIIILAVIFVSWSLKNDDKKLMPTSPSPIAEDRVQNKPLKVKVSIPYWDQKKAVTSFKKNVSDVNFVSLFWYFLGSDGDIHKYSDAKEDLSIVDFAHENGVKAEVVITNLPEDGDWDSDRVEHVLKDEQLLKKHIEQIVELSERLNIDGIDIDYEQLDQDLETDFSHFIKELGKALGEKGKYLGVALHPKSDDGIGNTNGALAQDWKTISEGADNLYIMAFNEHWDESGPGPIASLPWVERIVRYAQNLGIDKSKFFLTIPLFGYAWERDSDQAAKGLTYSDVSQLLEKYVMSEEWDETNASPHFQYEETDEWEVWYENARSVTRKIELAENAGFKGITFWRLGGEDPKIWNLFKD